MTYSYIIDQAVFRAILACAPKERRLLVDAFNRLSEAPFQEPDLKNVVEGREVLVRFTGPFTIAYWLDHAVKEVRIIHIFRD